MKKGKTLWITRDRQGVCLWEYREFPQKDIDGDVYVSDGGRLLSATDIINASGIILKPGQKVKVRLVTGEQK